MPLPVYDFSNPDDVERFNREKPWRPNFGNPDEALTYALGLPSREKRVEFVQYVDKYYGSEARAKLIAGLQEVAEKRGQ